MKIFIKYFVINVLALVFHYVLTVLGAMAFGGPSDSISRFEWIQTFAILMFVAILPNIVVWLFSVIRRKNIKENALWASVFIVLTVVVYIFNFRFIFE